MDGISSTQVASELFRSTYRTWGGMKQRCYNPKDTSYYSHGARGITVCDRWQIFENFIADVGRRLSADHSLERKDNDGNYEPGNVRWATQSEQVLNQRKVGTLSSERDTFAIRLDVVTGERDLIAAERDALAAQNLTLAAQLQAVAEQPRVPRKRKLPPPTEEPLF